MLREMSSRELTGWMAYERFREARDKPRASRDDIVRRLREGATTTVPDDGVVLYDQPIPDSAFGG